MVAPCHLALSAAPRKASAAEVEDQTRACTWYGFEADTEWFRKDLDDYGIVALSPDGRRIAVLAATDTGPSSPQARLTLHRPRLHVVGRVHDSAGPAARVSRKSGVMPTPSANQGRAPVAAAAELCTRPTAYCGLVAIWIRLPQVSSKTAVVTGPISRGSWVKRTPRSRRRWYSVCTSSTANWASGMPSSTSVSR